MPPTGYVLGQRSADAVKGILAKGPPPAGRKRGGGGAPVWALVRCTSDEPAGGSGIAATLYPGVRVTGDALHATPEDAGDVWLTVLGPGGTPLEPTEGQVYGCLVGGWAAVGEGEEADARPRCIATAAAFEFTVYRYTCEGGDLVETPVTVTVAP